MIKKICFLLLSFLSFAANAQSEPAMADVLRQNGKIFVVISVIAIIFVALVVFLVILERKLKKLEEKFNTK